MSKKSSPGPSCGGLKKGIATSAKIPWQVPSLNSCHRHKLGPNSKKSVPIREPMTRRLCGALTKSKNLVWGPSYGGLKTNLIYKWQVPSSNKFWWNQKFQFPSDRELPEDSGLWGPTHLRLGGEGGYNLVFLMHFTSINLNMPHQINIKIFPQKIYT